MIKIYYVFSDRKGQRHFQTHKISRECHLIGQGLMNNSRVDLVDNEKESDFVFLFGNPCSDRTFSPSKIVFIDYGDNPRNITHINCLTYFKRAWVAKVNKGCYIAKRPISWPSHFHPLTFAIMDEFIINEDIERDMVLSCTIRPYKRHLNRVRVLEFIKGLNIQGKKQRGALNKGTMYRFNDPDMREYFKLLKRSRIVVTCDPGKWEGDHRTWEAFASGALVFVDRMYTPMTHPLIDGKHCIFYELSDLGLEELRKKILYFLENTAHADAVAKEGFDFAMKYHRSSNRIDEILDVILK